MTTLQVNGVGSTSGATINAASTAGAGDNPFAFSIITGGSFTWDSANPIHGLNSMKGVGNGASGAIYGSWTGLSMTQVAAHIYIKLAALPSPEMGMLYIAHSDSTKNTVGISTTGKLKFYNNGAATTATVTVPLNTWLRIDVAYGLGVSQAVNVSVSTLDSLTPLDTIALTGVATSAAGATVTSARLGPATGTTTQSQTINVAHPALTDSLPAGQFMAPYITAPTLTGTVLATDTFTGADGSTPAAQWTVTLAGTTPGTALIQSNKVVLTPAAGAYSAGVTSMWLTGVPAVSNQEWDILCTLSPDATLRQHYMVLGMSTNGSIRSGDVLPGNGYGLSVIPASNLVSLNRVTSGSVTNLSTNLAYTYTAGTAVCVRVKMTGGSTLSVWVWNVGTNMPTTPTWTGTDPAPLTGTLKPILSASNGASSTAIPATFDDFSFASAAATQGWFIYSGTAWVHHIANERTATPAWVPAPASETA